MLDNICELPNNRWFSCELEKMLWLLRRCDEPVCRAWWLGYESALKGICFERVIFGIENNPELYGDIK